MTDFQHLLIERKGPVLWITLHRPQVKNAFHIENAREVLNAVRLGLRDRNVAVIVLSGSGDVFSAGGDIKLMSQTKDRKGFFLEISRLMHIAVRDMRRSEKPILAAIPGYVG